MFQSTQFDELAKHLLASLPVSLQNVEQDLHQKFNDILQVAFMRMNLVSRHEFDIQTKVLARTREKLDQLQEQLSTLSIIKKSNIDV